MSRDRRRRNRLWNLVVDDPYRKLVAIGLAILLWFFINSRIMESEVYTLPLAAVDVLDVSSGTEDRLSITLPTDRVVKRRFLDGDREIQNVRVTVSGPRFRIDALKEDRLNLAITTFETREWVGRGEGPDVQVVEFTADNIRRDVRALEEISIEMDPPRVRLEVGLQDNLVLEVDNGHVQFDAKDFESRLLRDTSQFSPGTVRIIGPARNIQKLSDRVKAGQPILHADLQQLGDEATGQLRILDNLDIAVVFEQTPSVRIDLEPTRQDYTFELPVVVDDLNLKPEDRGRFVPDLQSIPVRVSLSGRLRSVAGAFERDTDRQRWAAETMRLVVHLQRPEAGNQFGQELDREIQLVVRESPTRRVERSEFKLEDSRVVKLRNKNP